MSWMMTVTVWAFVNGKARDTKITLPMPSMIECEAMAAYLPAHTSYQAKEKYRYGSDHGQYRCDRLNAGKEPGR